MSTQKAIEAVKTASTAPRRFQRQRRSGWRMPEKAVYVGRGSKYGNPFVARLAPKGMVGAYPMTDNRYCVIDTRPNAPLGNYKLFPTFLDAARYAVAQYRNVALRELLKEDPDALHALIGYNLGCWCAEENPCHGDVLLASALELSNTPGLEA